jgi:hypothetical protein
MRFRDVPIGHVFRMGGPSCPNCFLRRDSKTYFVIGGNCEEHKGKKLPYGWRLGMGSPDYEVIYDPFSAMLEAQQPKTRMLRVWHWCRRRLTLEALFVALVLRETPDE